MDLLEDEDLKIDGGTEPNALDIVALKRRFYSTPASLRLANCLDACYEIDSNGSSRVQIERPFDWLYNSQNEAVSYQTQNLHKLIYCGLGRGADKTGVKPHQLSSFPGPYIEVFMCARIVHTLSSPCRDRLTLQKWLANFEQYHAGEVGSNSIGMVSHMLVKAHICARLDASEDSVLPFGEESLGLIQDSLTDGDLQIISKLRSSLTTEEGLSAGSDYFSRSLPSMYGFSAWVYEVLGDI